MKKSILLLILIFVINISSGQISTTKITEKPTTKNEQYDSTKNFLGEDFHKYVGQRLYLKGKRQELRQYGYRGFLIDYSNRNPRPPESNIYKCGDSFFSKYDQLVGKYFKVIGYFDHPYAREFPIFRNIYYLKIEEEDSKDIIYFEYNCEFEHEFPFIVVGFFEKLKKQIVGQKYVFVNSIIESIINIETGDLIKSVPNQIWECVDLTIDEIDYNLSLVVKNQNGNKTVIPCRMTIHNEYRTNVYKLNDAQVYQKKFGLKNWLAILDENVLIGFTEEMVKLSWGEPEKINRASYGDQWVYDGQYLYFKNGKMTSFN